MKRKLGIFSRILAVSLLILSISSLMSACSREANEPTIPTGFTQYTDKSGYFSIAYPSDWAVRNFLQPEVMTSIIGILKSTDTSDAESKSSTIFVVGAKEGGLPLVTVSVEQTPKSAVTHEQMVEAVVNKVKSIVNDYHESSRVETTISGKKATILEWDGEIGGVDEYMVQMVLSDGKITWQVICNAFSGESGKWKDDFQSITRNLHILK
jgi:hypothetical protein